MTRRSPLAALLLLALAGTAAAEYTNVDPSGLGTSARTGQTTQFYNGEVATYLAANAYDSGVYKFNLATLLPAGSTYFSATLAFGVDIAVPADGSSADPGYALSSFTSSTTTASLADFARPTTAIGSATVPASVVGTSLDQRWDVSDAVGHARDAGAAAVGFRLDPTSGFLFFGTAGQTRPVLIVQFAPPGVPEPASAALLGCGVVLAVAGYRVRRAS